jgi:aminoglycoside phosphotransferase (APT) family kinase protein
MHEFDPNPILSALGITDASLSTPVNSGWGGTALWRIHRDQASHDLLLRLFPGGPTLLAEREAAAQQRAREASVPVPAVIAWGQVGEDAALVTTWIEGEQVAGRLFREPQRAREFGERCGETLAQLHTIAIVDPILLARNKRNDWLGWAGDRAERLRPHLDRAIGSAPRDRLLHLDFHPENILIDDDGITGVVDWANVRVGPAAADVARTRSILALIKLHPDVPAALHPVINDFGDGLLEAYRRTGILPADLRPFDAWSFAAQLTDLRPVLDRANDWLTPEIYAAIGARYDDLIADLERNPAQQ